jgi:hypothetical protein
MNGIQLGTFLENGVLGKVPTGVTVLATLLRSGFSRKR